MPGWPERHAHPVVAALLMAAGLAAPLGLVVGVVASGRTWVGLSLDRTFLTWLAAVVAVAAIARVVAVVMWLGASERTRPRLGFATLAILAVLVPGMLVGVGAVRAINDIAPVFTPTADGAPLFDPGEVTPPATSDAPSPPSSPGTVPPTTEPGDDGDTPPHTTTTTTTTTLPPPLPSRPDSGVAPEVLDDVHTVLLLGGDAGPGRYGLRTDSMILFSLHTPSGRASLISIPRDLRDLLFPPGSAMEARHPYGFDNLANAVYPIVSAEPSLRQAYDVSDIRPGVVAIAEGIGYSLDVLIDDYVLIDMQGFIDLIDAVGGVTIDVAKQLPMPGNVPGARTQYPDTIGPGVIDMDGSTALGYVRSRYADSDFQRTERQRKLLAALARQVSFTDVVANYRGVTSAVGGTLRTSLTSDELSEVLAVIGGETAIVESVGLVPPLVSTSDPDYQRMAEVVGQVLVAIATGTSSGY